MLGSLAMPFHRGQCGDKRWAVNRRGDGWAVWTAGYWEATPMGRAWEGDEGSGQGAVHGEFNRAPSPPPTCDSNT